MTKTVTRYFAASNTLAGVREHPEGEFVRYADIKHLLAVEPSAGLVYDFCWPHDPPKPDCPHCGGSGKFRDLSAEKSGGPSVTIPIPAGTYCIHEGYAGLTENCPQHGSSVNRKGDV